MHMGASVVLMSREYTVSTVSSVGGRSFFSFLVDFAYLIYLTSLGYLGS